MSVHSSQEEEQGWWGAVFFLVSIIFFIMRMVVAGMDVIRGKTLGSDQGLIYFLRRASIAHGCSTMVAGIHDHEEDDVDDHEEEDDVDDHQRRMWIIMRRRTMWMIIKLCFLESSSADSATELRGTRLIMSI